MIAVEDIRPGDRVRYTGTPRKIGLPWRGPALMARSIQPGEIGVAQPNAYGAYERVHVEFVGASGAVPVRDLEVVDDEQ